MIVITIFKKGEKQKTILDLKKKKVSNQESKDTFLDGLDRRIKKIEQAIEKLGSKPVEYHINIDEVDIHNPVLDELSFNLDKLDIKDLSGALNLGNNFGVRVGKDQGSNKKPQDKDKGTVAKLVSNGRKSNL